jgi:hypothetical protein
MKEIIHLINGNCVLVAYSEKRPYGEVFAANVRTPEGLFPPQHLQKCDAYRLWRAGLFIEETDGLRALNVHDKYDPGALQKDVQSLTTLLGQGVSLLTHLKKGGVAEAWVEPTPDEAKDLFRNANAFVKKLKLMVEKQSGQEKDSQNENTGIRPVPTRSPMKDYEHNHQKLMQLLGDREYVRIENEPFMPLTVEKLEGQSLISLSHTRIQHGDLMRDPEIVFHLHEGTAQPEYILHDGFMEHATVEKTFGDVPVKPGLQKSLDAFCRVWWANLEQQGFFERAKELQSKQAIQQESTIPELKNYLVELHETRTYTAKVRVEATSPEEAEALASSQFDERSLTWEDRYQFDRDSKVLTENDRPLSNKHSKQEHGPTTEMDNGPEMEP